MPSSARPFPYLQVAMALATLALLVPCVLALLAQGGPDARAMGVVIVAMGLLAAYLVAHLQAPACARFNEIMAGHVGWLLVGTTAALAVGIGWASLVLISVG